LKKKVLIVEDEAAMLKALSDKLARAGFEVLIARNGEEGLEVAKEERPDCILLDVVMPKKDGISMLKELRSDGWGSDVPVILLTNLNADDEMLKNINQLEPSFYLVKSDWRIEDVVEKVRERIGDK
jgi:DNA-binding response OmpR family regulator